MKTLSSIIFLITLAAASQGQVTKTVDTIKANNSIIKHNTQRRDTLDSYTDTIQIGQQQYIQIFNGNNFNCLVSVYGDTIVRPENYYFKADFLDIDEDGYTDIRVYAYSNTPNQCDNYLFDRDLKTFKLIEGCDLDIKKLKGTQFYYSYNRSGCSDMNWESHLSKIEHYKLVDYGYIYGQGCDFEIKNNPQVIKIYKIARHTTKCLATAK